MNPTKVLFEGYSTFVEKVTLNGVNYEVWLAPGLRPPRYSVSFVVKEPHLRGALVLKPITDYLVMKGWLNPSNSIESVELGTEVISGSGTTQINVFRVVK